MTNILCFKIILQQNIGKKKRKHFYRQGTVQEQLKSPFPKTF